MVLMSAELDKIIRENVENESVYQTILELIDHASKSSDSPVNYLQQIHRLATTPFDSVKALYQAYLKTGCAVLGLGFGSVNQLDDDAYSKRAHYAVNAGELSAKPLERIQCNQVIHYQKTLAMHDMESSESRLLKNGSVDEIYPSFIGTPIRVDGQMVGILSFFDGQVRDVPFTDEERQFVELMAQGISHFLTQQDHRTMREHSNQQYRVVMENIETPVLVIDDNTLDILDANDSAVKFYGYTREEFRQLTAYDINMYPPEDINRVVDEARAQGRPYCRFPHRLKSGEIREVEVYLNTVTLNNQQLRFSIIYDYSERHQSEEALKRSEANLRAIFDNASQMMFLVDDTAKIVAMNRAAMELTNLKVGKLPKSGDTLHSFSMVADHYLNSDFIAQALKGKSLHHEARILDATRQIKYIAYRYVPVKTEDDQIIGVCVTGEDITELKQSERQLARERNVLRTLIDNVPDSIYIKDAMARILTVNKRYSLMAREDSAEELVGKTDKDIYPEYGEQYYEDDLAVIESGEGIANREEPFVLPDDSLGWFLTSKIPLRDSDGHVIGLVGVGRDITQRRQMEDALYRRDAILNTISEGAQLFLTEANWRDSIEIILHNLGEVLAVDRVYLFQNAEMVQGLGAVPLYEWAVEGVLKHAEHFEWGVYKWGLPRWIDELGKGNVIAGQVEDMPEAEQNVLKQRHTTSFAVVPVMVGTTWWGFMGFDLVNGTRDWPTAELDVLLTAASTLGAAIQREQIEQGLRDNEEKFSQLVSHIPEAFWIYDIESQSLVYLSPNHEDVFGVTLSGERNNSAILIEMTHEGDKTIMQQALRRQANGVADDTEVRWMNPQLGERWIQFRSYPIRNEDGEIYRVAGIASDVTDRKQAEANRVEVMVQRERIAVLANFFRDASHEFKTPLSIINTSLYLLGKSDRPDVRTEHHERIRVQVRGLSDLVETLVVMSKLDSGAELTMLPVNLNSVLSQVEVIIKQNFADRANDITISTTENMPPVMGNIDYIEQAINNLMDNAIRYTARGQSIFLRTLTDDDYVVIEVEDRGIGIPPELHTEIFKRFYRGDEAHSTRGFGLGLPIARSIMQRHGGDVTVSSTPKAGSIFRMLFPRVKVQ